ncbi:MAG: hypothetical protein V4621_07030 [Pseudomonadota bacterium]
MTSEDLKTGKDLDDLTASYTLGDAAGKRCLAITDELLQAIENYTTKGGAYGAVTLYPHLTTISADGAALLRRLGHSATTQFNFEKAYVLSDIGKIHQCYDKIDWMSDDRPSKAEKDFRRQHTVRGPDILDDKLRFESEDVKTHPHWQVVKSLMVYHHERMDGNGELHLAGEKIGDVLQVACMVDAYDGDMRKRAHQSTPRTQEEQLDRMQNDDKYRGAFAPAMLETYKALRIEAFAPQRPAPAENRAMVML